MSDIRFTSFPRTEPSPPFIADVVAAFRENEAAINTIQLDKGVVKVGYIIRLGPEAERASFRKRIMGRPGGDAATA